MSTKMNRWCTQVLATKAPLRKTAFAAASFCRVLFARALFARAPVSKTYFSRTCLASVLIAVILYPGVSSGWEAAATEERGSKPLINLLALPSDWVEMRFTPGSLDRAARLQGRLEDLIRHVSAWSKGPPQPLEVLVVSPDEWAALQIEHPFGFPVKKDKDSWYAPAWGTEGSVQLWKGLAGSEVEGIGQFQVRGNPKEIASLALADLVLEIEICRSFMSSRAVAGGAEGVWLNDLLGHVLCTASDQLRSYQDPVGSATLFQALAVAEGAPAELVLSDYGPDLDFATWLGFQARFAQGSQLIWANTGKASVKRILRMRRRKGAPLVFEDMLREYPSLSRWHPGAS